MRGFEGFEQVLIYGGVMLAVLVVLAINVQGEERADKQTEKAARRLADLCALDFTARISQAWLKELPGCFVFHQGYSSEAGRRMTGVYRRWNIALFELKWFDRGRHGEKYMRVDLVLVVALEERRLPAIQLLPLSIGEVVAEMALGTDRIVFEGSEADDRFSHKYSLWSDDRQAVERVFKPDVVRWFADRPGWRVWASGAHAVIWQPRWRGKFFAAGFEQWQSFLEGALDVIDVLTGGKPKPSPEENPYL